MNHNDHVDLLRAGVPATAAHMPLWADLGAGDGAFTLALADLLGAEARILAVDRDAHALTRLQHAAASQFSQAHIETRCADFTQPLDLPPLDGIIMANALHFVARSTQAGVVRQMCAALRPGGRLLMVEYNVDRGNTWVPHPFSYTTWVAMAQRAGFAETRLLKTVPSRFLGEIFSALSLVGAD